MVKPQSIIHRLVKLIHERKVIRFLRLQVRVARCNSIIIAVNPVRVQIFITRTVNARIYVKLETVFIRFRIIERKVREKIKILPCQLKGPIFGIRIHRGILAAALRGL